MLLLLKYKYGINSIPINRLIIYIVLLLCIGYFSKYSPILIMIVDMYFYMILTNFNIIGKKHKNVSQVKMEIVTEGVDKKENNDLANTILEYSDKLRSD